MAGSSTQCPLRRGVYISEVFDSRGLTIWLMFFDYVALRCTANCVKNQSFYNSLLTHGLMCDC